MNDQLRVDRLTDEDLGQAAGGMSCDAAIAVSRVYAGIGSIFEASGDLVMAAAFTGRALGVVEGAGCPR